VGLFVVSAQNPSNGSAADVEAARNLCLADAGAVKLPNLGCLLRRGNRTAELGSFAPGFGKSRANSFAENVAFELREYGEWPRHSAAGGCRQIESFGKRHESDTKFRQFFER
jgi:hypothetical protein